MTHSFEKRMVGDAASDGSRSRGVLGVVCAFAAALLPACSGCQVELVRSEEAHAEGLYRGLVVGGSEAEGAFVVAQHERAPGDEELVLTSLADDEKRTCSMGKALRYSTIPQLFGDRSAHVLTIDGNPGDVSGDLRIFDASCVERVRVPSVVAGMKWMTDENYVFEGYAAQTTSGEIVAIDPWTESVKTIAEGVSFWTYAGGRFWLIQDGSLVLRDREGNILQTAGEGVTELVVSFGGDEAAYVDAKGLWVMKPGDPGPTAIPTAGAPCKPEYLSTTPPSLAYRDDCAASVLAVRDRTTGDTRVFASGVTSVISFGGAPMSWLFFEREEPGKKRELWAVPGAGAPVLVGTDPRPRRAAWRRQTGFLVMLDYDGAAGTLGQWSLEGGFSPILENCAGYLGKGNGHFATLVDAEGDVGTLVVFDEETLVEALRAPGVHRWAPRFSFQAPALGYIRDWDDALGAGDLGVWISANGQQIEVDTGVSEFQELSWPESGILYAVRTPGRAGIRTAFPDF